MLGHLSGLKTIQKRPEGPTRFAQTASMPSRQASTVYTDGFVALKHRSGRGPFARQLIRLMHEHKAERPETSHSERLVVCRAATVTPALGNKRAHPSGYICICGKKKEKKKKNERRLQMTVPLYIIVCHTQSRRGREPPRIPKSCLQTCRADCFISMRNPFAKTRMTMTEATTRRQRTPSTRSSSRCFPFRENRFTQSIRFCCRHTNRINHLWTL